jgi:predicted nucleic-acid-binding Zn-ribbon protein
MSESTCPKCNCAMELGYTPETTMAIIPYQEYWISGKANWKKGLFRSLGTWHFLSVIGLGPRLTFPNKQLKTGLPITKLRCVECGYLESYAKNRSVAVRS